MEEKTKELLDIVKDKTKDRNANWLSGNSNTQYKLKLPSGRILVDRFRKPLSPGPDPTVVEGFTVSILNEAGDEIDSISAREDTEDETYNYLKDLWKSAERSYKQVDQVLDEMIEEVEGKENIGVDEESFEPDDDLPF